MTEYCGLNSVKEHRELLEKKRRLLEEGIKQRYLQLAALQRYFTNFRQHAEHIASMNISRLVVELETGGNIRMEEGKPTDVWFTSCVDLVRNRYMSAPTAAGPTPPGIDNINNYLWGNSHDMPPLITDGVRVTRVIRIHNRFLRNRFEVLLLSAFVLSCRVFQTS